MNNENPIEAPLRLTQFSAGAGCGCKIAPALLKEMLETANPQSADKNLLVGTEYSDDAAVYDIGNGQALISSTDFFTPLVDDAFDFGRIAAANAISDIYAMGGNPILAIAILGWPVEKLGVQKVKELMDGARSICTEAGITLAGGHSIAIAEPIFGLSVNGLVAKENIRQNHTANAGDLLFLTKAIGVGILATAEKRGIISSEQHEAMIKQMTELNRVGAVLGNCKHVTAMTDVTGFGLLGHLHEMATGAGLSAEIMYNRVKIINGAVELVAQRIVPDACYRNWNNYSSETAFDKGVNVLEAFHLLCDPQTNGGLLFAVNPDAETEIINLLKENKLEAFVEPIGRMLPRGEKMIQVK